MDFKLRGFGILKGYIGVLIGLMISGVSTTTFGLAWIDVFVVTTLLLGAVVLMLFFILSTREPIGW